MRKGSSGSVATTVPTNGIRGLKPVADDQLLKFTPDGKLVLQIGRSNQSKGNADTRNLHRPPTPGCMRRPTKCSSPTDTAIIASSCSTPTPARSNGCGARFAERPMDDDHCEVVTPKTVEDRGPRNFSIVHALRVARDGMVYVADRENRRIQSFTADGKFVKQLVKADTQFARNVALSPDRDQQFLYVGNGDDIVIVDRRRWRSSAQSNRRGLKNGGHQIATDSKGNLYVAQTTMGLQKLTFKGMSPAGEVERTRAATPA